MGYNSDEVIKDIKSATTLLVTSTTATLYKYNAVFGRFNYRISNKYILSANIRRDGTSRYGPKNRFHNFGSLSGAWIFSSENVIKDKVDWLSFGKLRLSYGTTGNDQLTDYQYLDRYSPYGVGVAYQGVAALVPQGLVNPYLQWEETRKIQFGLDIGVLKDRILFNVNYMKNISSNQLIPYTLPSTTGYSFINRNFPASVQNTGWEFSLNTLNISRKSFTWRSIYNLTVQRNKLNEFPDFSKSTYASSLIIGQPIGLTKLFKSAGVNPSTGMYQFVDSKGNITSSPNSLADKTLWNVNFPSFYGGVQNSFVWRSVTIDLFVNFVKQRASNYSYGNFYPGTIYNNLPTAVLNRWQKSNDHAAVQKYSTGFPPTSSNYSQSDAAYSDASYIRLKNISVSWQVPGSWHFKNSPLSIRAFAQGQNLITFTKYNGLDPENLSLLNIPPLRIFTMGIQIGL